MRLRRSRSVDYTPTARPALRLAAQRACEPLEKRVMLAGWQAIAHAPPAFLGNAMLLTDGTVMVHGQADNATKSWYRLTPDSTGSYQNGTWTTLAQMGLERLFFPTNMLLDGRVFALGGEYTGPNTDATWGNAGEIYNPVTNTWSSIPNYPAAQFGDVPTMLMNDGRVIAGNLINATTNIYDPATNMWVPGPGKLNGDRSDEETWIKLQDNSILSYDIFAAPRTQRLSPVTNAWVFANSTPVPLQTSDGFELGPGFRLPDGRAVQIGGNNHNAIYNPATNHWAALLDTPGGIGGNDAPGAELPNGHILYAAGDISINFNPPTTYFDMDPVNNTITPITSPTGGATQDINPFLNTMLMLPTGQVLLTTNSKDAYIYTPDGGPNDAWRPIVSGISNNSDGTFTLTGSQLNGQSQGASYGDDNEMDSNYPVIRLTSSTGVVRYARSFNWNTAGVGVNGSTSVQFTLPSGITGGAYKLEVSGAGINSKPVFVVFVGASTGTNVSIRTNPGDSTMIQGLAGVTDLGSFTASQFVGAYVVGDNLDDTLNISGSAGLPTTVNGGGGDDAILVSLSSTSITAQGGAGANDTVFVVGSGAGDTLSVSSTSVGGAANITYSSDVENLELDGNGGADSFIVNSTSASTAVRLDGGAGADGIDAEGSTSTVTLVDSPDADSITVNNAAAQFADSGNTVASVSLGSGGSLDASSGSIDFNTLNLSGGSLTGSSNVTINTTMNWTAGSSSGAGTLTIGAGATMTDSVAGTSRSKALNMQGAGSIDAGGTRLLVTNGFSFSGAGVFDLNDNDMIVDYTSGPQIAGIVAAIVSARAGSAWNGPGLTGSFAKNAIPKVTTLGAMETTDYKTINPGATTFDGEPVDNTSVVIKYTYYGDANFNGKVDGTDYARIDSSFNAETTAGNIGGWMNGDNNYDGKVNGADYGFIDAAFNGQSGPPLRPSAANDASKIISQTGTSKVTTGGKTSSGGAAKH